MGGFCPDDWHGTTEADLQARSWGDDYHYWADVAETTARLRRQNAHQIRYVQETTYAEADAAIAQAKSEGLVFHLLPEDEQIRRLDAVIQLKAPTHDS